MSMNNFFISPYVVTTTQIIRAEHIPKIQQSSKVSKSLLYFFSKAWFLFKSFCRKLPINNETISIPQIASHCFHFIRERSGETVECFNKLKWTAMASSSAPSLSASIIICILSIGSEGKILHKSSKNFPTKIFSLKKVINLGSLAFLLPDYMDS